MTRRRALITGATGFVGSNLTRRLLREGFEVHVVCRSESSFERLADVRRRLHVHPVGLERRARLRAVVRAVGPHYVFHLAGAAMRGGMAARPGDIVRTNVLGTINLIDACDGADYEAFVNTGDAFEYGVKRRPARETDRCVPRTVEGRAKLIGTLYGRVRAMAARKPLVTLRLFSVFGPFDHPRRLVPRIMAGALAARSLRLSRPDVVRDFLYVADVADLYLHVADAAGRLEGCVLNAGSGRPTSIAELVDRIGRLTPKLWKADWGAYPVAAHDRDCWIADVGRTQSLLRWRPRFTLDAGLRATWQWARRNREWWK